MEAQKIKEYNVSRMSIEKNVISWEGHAVRLPGVVRIWVGDSPRRTFPISMVLILLMIALSGPGIVNKAVMLAVLGIYIREKNGYANRRKGSCISGTLQWDGLFI